MKWDRKGLVILTSFPLNLLHSKYLDKIALKNYVHIPPLISSSGHAPIIVYLWMDLDFLESLIHNVNQGGQIKIIPRIVRGFAKS